LDPGSAGGGAPLRAPVAAIPNAAYGSRFSDGMFSTSQTITRTDPWSVPPDSGTWVSLRFLCVSAIAAMIATSRITEASSKDRRIPV
jgi:hypothetical protein